MDPTLMAASSAQIHPDLKLEAMFAKATGVLLIAAGLAFFAFSVVLLGVSTGSLNRTMTFESSPSLTGWLVIGTCFVVAMFLAYCGRHLRVEHLGRLRRVSWLLQNSQPVTMRLVPDLSGNAPTKRASLFYEGRGDLAVPDDIVDIRSPGWRFSEIQEEVVRVYRDPDPEGIVAMVTSTGVLWGQKASMELPPGALGRS